MTKRYRKVRSQYKIKLNGTGNSKIRARWTSKDLSFLRLNHNRFEYKELGWILGRTRFGIKNIIIKKGWAESRARWSSNQEFLLKKTYVKTKSVSETAKLMNRSRYSIYSKARRLGILEH